MHACEKSYSGKKICATGELFPCSKYRSVVSRKAALKILVSVIFPLYVFIFEISQFFLRGKVNKFAVGFGAGVFGFSYIINNESIDVFRIVKLFEIWREKDYSYLFEKIVLSTKLSGERTDFFQDIILFLTSRITDNPKLLLLLLAGLSGYFYALVLEKISILIGKNVKKKAYVLGFLLVVFVFPTQIINQFRFWAASCVYVLIVLYVFASGSSLNRLSSSVLFVLPLFIHIGMIVPVGLIILFICLLKSNRAIYVVILLLSMIFILNSKVTFREVFDPIAFSAGGAIEHKYSMYTTELSERRFEVFKNRSWYAAYWRELIFYSLSTLTVCVVYCRRKMPYHWIDQFFLFNVLFIPVALLLRNFYMNFRYIELFAYLQLIALFINLNLFREYRLSWCLRLVLTPLFLFVIAFKVARALDFVGLEIFYVNYLTGWFTNSLHSVWGYIDFI